MPRQYRGPRLFLDRQRDQWVIRDRHKNIRTDCFGGDTRAAEKRLAEYIASKHVPAPSASPLIADVLNAYAMDKASNCSNQWSRREGNIAHCARNLARWWKDRSLHDVSARSCRAYADSRPHSAARRDLETLRAAIRHWHKEYGPLPSVPQIWLPPKEEPRDRWLTRKEAARLLNAARNVDHLKRFILLGVYTGTRSSALFAVCWNWIDLDSGVMHRRAPGTADSATKRKPPVRLGRRILAHMRRWKRIDGPLVTHVVHYDGLPIRSVKRSWSQAVKRAGLSDDVTPHCLRRTRATWLMQAGVDMWEAAGHLGMTVDMLTKVYAKHHPSWQKRAANV